MRTETWTIRGDERDTSMGEAFDPRIDDDHKCSHCTATYPCERSVWDGCDCPIYCGACEEARQETPGP